MAHSFHSGNARYSDVEHGCVALSIAMLILVFMKFEVSELDFPDILARLPAWF